MFVQSSIDFIRAELRTGLTLSRIALDTSNEQKRERNRINDRKAYDAILHFLPTAMLSEVELTEINKSVASLRGHLQTLGEQV